jgi:hypothetical protein
MTKQQSKACAGFKRLTQDDEIKLLTVLRHRGIAGQGVSVHDAAFRSLHSKAQSAFGLGAVDELIEDTPGWPWFVMTFADSMLTVSYHPNDDEYVVADYDRNYVRRFEGDLGTRDVWSLMRRRRVRALSRDAERRLLGRTSHATDTL